MTTEEYIRKHNYLNKHIFNGLNNLNDGFDSLSISHFAEKDFFAVLERCRDNSVGIYGIEVWQKDEKVFDHVITFEDYGTFPKDDNWYFGAFDKLRSSGKDYIYSASYYVAGNAF